MEVFFMNKHILALSLLSAAAGTATAMQKPNNPNIVTNAQGLVTSYDGPIQKGGSKSVYKNNKRVAVTATLTDGTVIRLDPSVSWDFREVKGEQYNYLKRAQPLAPAAPAAKAPVAPALAAVKAPALKASAAAASAAALIAPVAKPAAAPVASKPAAPVAKPAAARINPFAIPAAPVAQPKAPAVQAAPEYPYANLNKPVAPVIKPAAAPTPAFTIIEAGRIPTPRVQEERVEELTLPLRAEQESTTATRALPVASTPASATALTPAPAAALDVADEQSWYDWLTRPFMAPRQDAPEEPVITAAPAPAPQLAVTAPALTPAPAASATEPARDADAEADEIIEEAGLAMPGEATPITAEERAQLERELDELLNEKPL